MATPNAPAIALCFRARILRTNRDHRYGPSVLERSMFCPAGATAAGLGAASPADYEVHVISYPGMGGPGGGGGLA
jgi:hypothetical protein